MDSNKFDIYEIIAIIFIIGTLLFLFAGGNYCELAPGAPYC